MSALYGLLDPDEVVSPYDVTLKDIAPIDRAAWLLSVAHELVNRMGVACEPRELIVEIHAGADYAEPLHEVLRAVGFRPARPLEGLGIGAQMAWYKRPPYEPGRTAPWAPR